MNLVYHLIFLSLACVALAETIYHLFSEKTHHTRALHDERYDNPNASVLNFRCGKVLSLEGYETLGSLPTYPYVAGFHAILDNLSMECGACYKVSHRYNGNNFWTIYALAIDTSKNGVMLSKYGMKFLLGGTEPGPVEYTEVDPSKCQKE